MTNYFAENYQLKWHSHGVHLHSSVASLHRSLSFADVTLVTIDGRCLSAHRFILSACSAYFSHLFNMRPASTAGSNLVVVLPTEITYQTLSILLQYMYSGEATVSNDQLSSVLKAGELLSIRGLCYNQADGKREQKKSEGILMQRRNSNQSDSESSKKDETTKELRTESLSNDGSDVENMRVIVEKDKTKMKKKEETAEKPMDKGSEEGKEANEKVNKKIEESNKDNEKEKEPTLEQVVGVAENMQIELMIKEEPIEWNDSDGRISGEDGEIRMEIYDGDEAEESHQFYAPLTCDMCGETFNTPALWVRHVETHPASEVPQRRNKRSSADGTAEDSNEFPPLRCELCQEVFTVPGDWVRHIQESHTDEQLAMSNNSSKPPASEQSTAMLASLNQRRKRILNSRKRCPICEKSFPSHASMLIHSRTHTGERPYICEHCEKGFNVKSNLLRHMRTLHDQMVVPLQF
ncbi:unnamed protein product [Bemisia tabaci]|uniref:Uncharacterized protein n=1 Tax=Bemisia tabaci TaxID=7038 RepID=A0A9P0A9G4_BEMTA|nr:unnamed protein product [Bemisia tabaci]